MESLFLDIGSGSGLHSLAARRMGAIVHSFDYDPQSVACTKELKRRYFSNDKEWTIEKGSILENEFIAGLGEFDICYAWGVLHHTGTLWQALENAQRPVREGGSLFVAIYNDQGPISIFWRTVKRSYCSGQLGRTLMGLIFYPVFFSLAWQLTSSSCVIRLFDIASTKNIGACPCSMTGVTGWAVIHSSLRSQRRSSAFIKIWDLSWCALNQQAMVSEIISFFFEEWTHHVETLVGD